MFIFRVLIHFCIAWLLTDRADVSGSSNNEKFIFKSSLVRVSVLKKPNSDSSGNKASKGEETKQEAELNETVRSNGLQSLCQQYESDDEDV